MNAIASNRIDVYDTHYEQRGSDQAVEAGGMDVAGREGVTLYLCASGASGTHQRAASTQGFGKGAGE